VVFLGCLWLDLAFPESRAWKAVLEEFYSRNLHRGKGGVGKAYESTRLWVVEGGSLTPFVL